jgi:hypothetical protein
MSEIPSASLLTADVVDPLIQQLRRPLTYATVFALVRRRHIAAPVKDRAGNYRWLPRDVEAAKAVLAARPVRQPSKANK